MRWLKTILAAMLLLLPCVAAAESIDPDLRRLVREAERPKVHYGPARVGWNPSPPATRAANPVYESLRMDSAAAIRRELKAVVLPDWQIILALGGLILGLRLLRTTRDTAMIEAAPNVVPFPAAPIPHQEAA